MATIGLDSRSLSDLQQKLDCAQAQVNDIVLGKAAQVRLAFACILAGGHLLIEDSPGVAKTTLARALARTLQLDFRRIQFTSDLLPADIIGVSTFEGEQQRFQFHPGALFTQLLLADEINRATPKTQSALLEAMAEGQVSSDNQTRALPHPFIVIATQNPLDMAGTFPLPDSQLDRFMLRIGMGYPDRRAERALLAGEDRRQLLQHTEAVLDDTQLLEARRQAAQVTVSDALLDYLQALLEASRRHAGVRTGLSPRAGLALLAAARALAWLDHRNHVLPEDIQTLFVPAAAHRIVTEAGVDATQVTQPLLDQVPVD